MTFPDYPFASKWIALSRGRMHYVDEGAGLRTIVLVHGTPTWSYEWRHVIRALSSRFRVVALDHLGFGLSERPVDGDYTPEWHSANFAEFIDRVVPEKFTLVVHDFGGPIALGYAQRTPQRIDAVVVLNSWMWSFDDDPEMRSRARVAGSAFGRFLYRWANFSLRVLAPSAYGDRRKLTREIHRVYLDRFPDRWSRGAVLWALARSLNGSRAFFNVLWAGRARLAELPMLIVWGMKDSAFKPHQLARWTKAYPQARVVRLEDAGHWPHEEEPDAVTSTIASFLGS